MFEVRGPEPPPGGLAIRAGFRKNAVDLGRGSTQLIRGSRQKVALAKWLATASKVLILDEPTLEIDVAAKSLVYSYISEPASAGFPVLLIS